MTNWVKQNNIYDNLTATTINLLLLLQVPFSKKFVLKFLKSSHSRNSLLAAQDLLKILEIESIGVQINYEQLNLVEFPVIAYLKEKDGPFHVITNVEEKTVTYISPKRGWVKDSLENFKEKWSGTTLLVGTSPESGIRIFQSLRRRKIKQVLVLVIFLLSFVYGVVSLQGLFLKDIIYWIIFILINTFGIVICYSLFIQASREKKGLNSYYPNIDLILSSIHPNLGHNRVKFGAQIFSGFFSFEEFLASYFIGNYLIFITNPEWVFNSSVIYFIETLMVMVLVTSCLFIYKSLTKYKQISITYFLLYSLIAFELILVNWNSSILRKPFGLHHWLQVINFYIIASVVWYFIRTHILDKTSKQKVHLKLKKILESKSIVESIIQSQIELIPNFDFDLRIGKEQSPYKVILLLDFNNHRCLKMITDAQRITQENEDISFNLIFKTESLKEKQFLNYILLKAKNESSKKALDIIMDRYTRKFDFEILFNSIAKNPIQVLCNSEQTINNWNLWIKENNIETPSVIVNNRLITEPLSIEDLIIFFER